MYSLWAVIRAETRLAWRRPTFWAVQLLWLLPLALTYLTNLGSATIPLASAFVGEQLVIALMMWLVLLPLIVGPALTRDLGEAGEIIWTTPLDALTHLLGVSVGLLLVLLSAILAHLGVQWLVGYLLLGSPAVMVWQYGLPLLLASTVAALGMAVLLTLLLRRTLPLLLVWVAVCTALLQAAQGFFGTIQSVALASPANLFFHSLQLSPSVGLGPSRSLVQGLLLWFLGLGALVALVALGAAIIADPRRAVRPGRTLLAWVVLATLLGTGGGLLHARAARAQAIPLSPADIQPNAWQVDAHTLTVAVDAAHHTLAGSSTLRLVPSRGFEENEVVLRLNPGMRVTAARDEVGNPLAWQRVGDSVIVELTARAEVPVVVRLQWQGRPQVPYSDYGASSGSQYLAFNTPQPVRALLAEGAGYLLRDGDWYPWPWGDGPHAHQAPENQVTIRVAGGEALATAPLDGGEASWEGQLPDVLLVLPPSGSRMVDGRVLHFGPAGGTQSVLVTRLEQIAELVPRVAAAVGAATVPSHIVALPYLNDVIWSGNLLLVPEGTGIVRGDLRSLLLSPGSRTEVRASLEERAVMTILVRAWLTSHSELPAGWVRVDPDVPGAVAVTGLPGEAGIITVAGAAGDEDGRWIGSLGPPGELLPGAPGETSQPPLARGQDLRTIKESQVRLGAEDHLELLALWLAVEMADPEVREGDLAVLLAPPDPGTSSAKFEPFALRLLPIDFPLGQGKKGALVGALHSWLEVVGRERGLQLVGEVIQEWEGSFHLAQLVTELSQLSGVTIEYEESE